MAQNSTVTSSHQRCYIGKGALKNSTKIHRKTPNFFTERLCQTVTVTVRSVLSVTVTVRSILRTLTNIYVLVVKIVNVLTLFRMGGPKRLLYQFFP